MLNGLGPLSAVGTVGIEHGPPRRLGTGLSGDVGRRVAVLNVGGSEGDGQQKANVSTTRWRLRPLTFLPASNPVQPPRAVQRVLRASIDHRRRSGSFADTVSLLLAQTVHRFEQTNCRPAAEGFVAGLPRREGFGQ